jgi:hypothetical protein
MDSGTDSSIVAQVKTRYRGDVVSAHDLGVY